MVKKRGVNSWRNKKLKRILRNEEKRLEIFGKKKIKSFKSILNSKFGKRKKETLKLNLKETILKRYSSPPTYSTYFDTLLKLIEKKKRIPLSDVVKEFGIDKNTANDWGEILSENEVIDFYIPIFGEPEFREKGLVVKSGKKEIIKSIKKIKPNKKIVGTVGALLILAIFVSLLFIQKDVEVNKVVEKEVIKTEEPEKASIGVDVSVKEAFSGKGDYECRTTDGKIKYLIKDNMVKIEQIDGTSKVVVKNNKVYTLNTNTNKWIISPVKNGLAVPGSGIYPKVDLDCKRAEIKTKEFEI